MSKRESLKYVAGELSTLIGRKLVSHEFARLGVAVKHYSFYELCQALDIMEDLINREKINLDQPVGLLQTILSSKKASQDASELLQQIQLGIKTA